MAIIKGRNLMLFIDGKAIGYSTSHTLSINAEVKESSSKDYGRLWQCNEIGLLSWSATSENLMSFSSSGIGYHQLVEFMFNRTPLQAVFSLTSTPDLDNVPSGGWGWEQKVGDGFVGNVIITGIEVNAPNGENATFTVTFTGTGALLDNCWYIVNSTTGVKTKLDNTTIQTGTDSYYFIWRGKYYNILPMTTKITVNGTPQLVEYNSPSAKQFAEDTTVQINVRFISERIGYVLDISET